MVGLFAAAVIKKRCYRPRHVPDNCIKTKEIRDVNSLQGKIDYYDYDLSFMVVPDYTMKLMSTYGGLTMKNGQKESNRIYKDNNGAMKMTTFRYTGPFLNHFLYRHNVDDHKKASPLFTIH